MKFKKIKKKDSFAFPNCTVERDYVDDQLTRISIKDNVSGEMFIVQKDSYYDFAIMIPEPPVTKTVFRLVGEIDGVPIQPLDYESEAEAASAAIDKNIKGVYAKVVVAEPT